MSRYQHSLSSLLHGLGGHGPPRRHRRGVGMPPLMVYMLGLDDPLAQDDDENDDDDENGGEDDGDDHDSQTSDDESNLMDPGEEINPAYAADLLEDLILKYPRYRLRDLKVDFRHPRSYNTDEASVLQYRSDFPAMFRQLVDGLAGYRRILRLSFRHGNFGDPPDDNNEEGDEVHEEPAAVAAAAAAGGGNDRPRGVDRLLQPDQDDLENLFGTVLFVHARLDYISLSASRIQTKYWKLYTESFPSTGYSLFRLMLEHVPLTMEHCHLLKHMLQRSVQLSWLALTECGLGNDEWRVVAEGVAANPHTHTFMIGETHAVVQRGTLLPLLRSPSVVRRLAVCAASWSDDEDDDDGAFEEFVRELRTNTVLRDVRMHRRAPSPFSGLHSVEKLLRTYNFRLEAVELHPCGRSPRHAAAWTRRIEGLLERNARVRAVFRQPSNDDDEGKGGDDNKSSTSGEDDDDNSSSRRRKSNPDPLHLSRRSAWNLVLREYSRFPTLLYRFIRTSNLVDFIDQVQPQRHLQQQEQAQEQAPEVHSDPKKSKMEPQEQERLQQAKRRR
jgi:hypothetical protein